MQGKVTRSGEVTIPYKNFTIAPQLQCLRESYENFGILTPGDVNFDLSQKMTEMISKLFFASFRTPFSVLFYDAQEPR